MQNNMTRNITKIIRKEKKKWAYKHGFLPSVVERYGINDDNYEDFISLYDYCHIFPVNDIFRKWINDRVTTRDVLKPFAEYLPRQYFQLYKRDSDVQIIKLLDCPDEYEDTYEGILQLIQDKGKLSIAKPSVRISSLSLMRMVSTP